MILFAGKFFWCSFPRIIYFTRPMGKNKARRGTKARGGAYFCEIGSALHLFA
jgi:hypothetical protein